MLREAVRALQLERPHAQQRRSIRRSVAGRLRPGATPCRVGLEPHVKGRTCPWRERSGESRAGEYLRVK